MSTVLKTYVKVDINKEITEINSLDFNNKIQLPKNLFFCLYGTTSKMALKEAHSICPDSMLIRSFNLKFSNDDKVLSNRADLNDAPSITHLNIARINVPLEGVIISYIIGLNKYTFKCRTLSKMIDEYPNMINDIFNFNLFKKLNVIIWRSELYGADEKVDIAAIKDITDLVIVENKVAGDVSNIKII